ncbi:MAG: glycosyltransferase family 4 protein [Deltaproteobacteria bacterium]|nr:glycosyltransferase family 4 protein [Deltaproteobacteria bacterium]
MRILMFGWEFPPYMSGGLGTACLGMTRALTDARIKILFVMPGQAPAHEDRFMRFIDPDVYRVRNEREDDSSERNGLMTRFIVNSSLTPYQNVRTYGPVYGNRATGILSGFGNPDARSFSPYGSNLFSEVWRYAYAAETIALSETFDIIHSHDWMTVPAAIRAREISGRPWIFHVHSLEQDRSGESVNPEIFDMERRGLAEADRIIAVSNYTRKRIVDCYGIPVDRIAVVHNGVTHINGSEHINVFRKPGQKKNVLFLGRITFQKGPAYFIEAAAEVLKRIPETTFLMAGSGDMMTGMIERVAELGIGKHFHFTGFLRGEDVDHIFRMSNLYVMPSVSEPFGLSPLEATRYGVPVILSRQSGVAEVFHHCLLVDFWDVRDMVDKIIALLRYEPLVRELQIRAREELLRTTWEGAASKIEAVYKAMLN